MDICDPKVDFQVLARFAPLQRDLVVLKSA
jgi:hypothetical protein